MADRKFKSAALGGLSANFNLFLPGNASEGSKVPLLTFLSGLTCTKDNAAQKGHFSGPAAEEGIAILFLDTSRRGAGVEGETDSWDFGVDAGFYLNATDPKWLKHYNILTHITLELLQDFKRQSIFGHSMGGHGALTFYLNSVLSGEKRYRSLSAFAPIANPDLKKSFLTTSSAIAANPPAARAGQKATPGQLPMERYHEALIQKAFVIYNTYLAPSSQSELNIDYGLRKELSAYLSEAIQSMTGKTFQGHVDLEQANHFNTTQLQTRIRLHERNQTHVFRLMATDSVPMERTIGRFHRSVYSNFLSTLTRSAIHAPDLLGAPFVPVAKGDEDIPDHAVLGQ
ncbi:Alpha/Beta hydrolase protein [Lenzites betulinus]|nr:Alpha/Beta hydrolase protein [Lenzites betulinus]